MIGRVHSIESFGTVDGPGIRMVIFLSGCPMRCLYCHNPDTWDPKGGTPMTVEQLLNQYDNARHFYRKGGITVSGGEPLTQIGFVTELFEAAKKRGIHTCLDTSGVTFRPDSAGVREKFDRLAAVTDLVLLDISLPFFDGYYWCQEIRKTSQVPIIFISSAADDMNLVMAVNMGADDFLAKPFRLEVVLAKIQALLRRAYTFGTRKDVIHAGEATLSLSDATLAYNGQKLELTKNEFRILSLLMEKKGCAVSRDEIICALWEN